MEVYEEIRPKIDHTLSLYEVKLQNGLFMEALALAQMINKLTEAYCMSKWLIIGDHENGDEPWKH